jgi:hypothetical protein
MWSRLIAKPMAVKNTLQTMKPNRNLRTLWVFSKVSGLWERPAAANGSGFDSSSYRSRLTAAPTADGYALCIVLMDMPISAFGPVPAWVRVPTEPKSVNRGGL